MNYREIYLKRHNDLGESYKDSFRNQSKTMAKEGLLNSLDRVDVKVNFSENHACVIRDVDASNVRKFIFAPDADINLGDYIEYSNVTYLTLKKNSSDIFPYAEARLCNSTFPLHTTITEILIGEDPRTGRPVYEEESQLITVPCIIESRYTQANDTKNFQIPEDRLTISAQYKEDNNAELNYEFDAYNDRYRIVDVDLTLVINGTGIIKIIAEKV